MNIEIKNIMFSVCLASMVEASQDGPDVSEGGTDARQGILLLRLQKDKMGLTELLLGREHH